MTRNVKECIFCPLQRYRRGWTSDVIIARPMLIIPLHSVVVTDDGGAKEYQKSGTQGGNNTWTYHRDMDAEVSQYLETECRHSIVQWDCPFHDVVVCISFSRQLDAWSATSIAELNFTWGRIDLQWKCRRADPYCVLREKGHFSFPTNRYWTSREGSTRRTSIAIRWRSVVTSAVLLIVYWTSVGLSERCQVGRYLFWILTHRRCISMDYNGGVVRDRLAWSCRYEFTRKTSVSELDQIESETPSALSVSTSKKVRIIVIKYTRHIFWRMRDILHSAIRYCYYLRYKFHDAIQYRMLDIYLTLFEISQKIQSQKIDDRWKINHEFNYCTVDYLIICRIDVIWLLNLFLFDITLCFRLSCHDDVNDSNHYSESS